MASSQFLHSLLIKTFFYNIVTYKRMYENETQQQKDSLFTANSKSYNSFKLRSALGAGWFWGVF